MDLQQLRELSQTFPLFAEKRVILLDRTGILKSGKEAFLEILNELPDTTCMILVEPEADKRTKIYKWIKKNGYVGEFLKKDQTEKVLMRWVAALLAKASAPSAPRGKEAVSGAGGRRYVPDKE